jgi:DNA repair exonuclease SbcCD ATPase subunit
MITHLLVENFQSWKEIQLELAPITVIVGKGDTGKSALLRAMIAALTNQGGDDFIRRGAAKATVGMVIDGHMLVWEKAKGVGGTYDLDGVQFTKTGQTVPKEIQDVTGFRALEVDKNYSVMPNIHGQFDQPFLVFESGSRMARILGKLTKVDTLVNAQMLARKDLKVAQDKLAVAQKQSAELQLKLDAMPDVEALRDEYNQVREAVQEASAATATHTAVEQAVRAYRTATRKTVDYSGLAEQCRKAREACARWDAAESAGERFYRAVAVLADAALGVDKTTERLAELTALYHSACSETGVCSSCPWK